MTTTILSCLAAVGILVGSAVFILQGDVLTSVSQFCSWTNVKEKLRSLRHVRRLVNVPFHVYLHRKTCRTVFCLGQVWVGVNNTMKIMGKTQDGDWIAQLPDNVTLIADPGEIRQRIYDHAMYLYEWDETLTNHVPTVGMMNGIRSIVLKQVPPPPVKKNVQASVLKRPEVR